MMNGHTGLAPSDWVVRWAQLLAPGCEVLDLACGHGRHALYLAGLGHRVLAVDRDPQSLATIARMERIETLETDLETGDWPLGRRQFGAVLVTNYLHRPLFPALLDALDDQGVLIYETFAKGNERFGKPSNPAFLLAPGELLELVRGRLHVIAYEDRYIAQPKPAQVQRICARAADTAPGA